MSINLDWSDPKEIKKGIYIQTAYPTDAFWSLWRSSKFELASQGVSLKRFKLNRMSSAWKVQRFIEIVDKKPVPLKTVPIPLVDTSGVLDYQIPVVAGINAAMVAHGRALNLSDTGTGKTYMALATARDLGYTPCIICPLIIVPDWIKVCKYFKINPLFVVNWEKARTTNFMYTQKLPNRLGVGYKYHWLIPKAIKPLLIFDEIHKSNSEYTLNQALLLGALEQKYDIMGLSATLTDTIAQFKGAGKLMNLFDGDKFESWLIERGMVKDKYGKWNSLNSKEDMKFLSKFIFPEFGARISKNNIPGFPECQNIAQLVQIKGVKEHNIYTIETEAKIKDLKRQHKAKLISGRRMSGELLVLRLRYRQLTEILKVDTIVNFAKDLHENGFSVAIFVNFTETIYQICEKLHTKCIIDGSVKGAEREKNIADFQADKERYMVCNIRAGGVGVSLHDLNGKFPRASIIAPTDSPKDLLQVCGRIHRAGALTKAANYLIYAAGTIEEKKIYPNVINKIRNISILNDGDLGDVEFFTEKGL